MDFESNSTEILLNPRIDPANQAHITSLLESVKDQFPSHVILASSGTTKTSNDSSKMVALSKHAILASASAVNTHLNATSKDIWLNSLPEFHVGGLGILARAHLTNSKVVKLPEWNPQVFFQLIESHKVTLTSLVPAQVYDLCQLKLKAPASLRAVIVGGGALNQQLYDKARSLGWPLLVSYGLTEAASQVATSTLDSQNLHILSHIEAKVNNRGFLCFKSQSLLSAYILIICGEICVFNPKSDGWLTSEDLGHINNHILTVLGRQSDFIKIGGESVHFSHLEKRFEEIKLLCNLDFDAAIIPFPDERLSHVVHLAATSPHTTELVEAFNASVMPYERIRHIHHLPHLPRTALKKLIKPHLLQLLGM